MSSHDGQQLCVASAEARQDALHLARTCLKRQCAELERYAMFQIGLNASSRVCALWRPSPSQRADRLAMEAHLGLMMELLSGGRSR
ncbi:hypothetical protein ACA040_005077 [Xenophilus aerolatus]